MPQAVGFVDPKTKETRTIPFEVLAAGDADPTYGDTLEDLGRYLQRLTQLSSTAAYPILL
jgi:peptidylprolyl isomerase